MLRIIPANSGAKALVIFRGKAAAVGADVVAWCVDDSWSTPPQPLVAASNVDRIAVFINAVQLFEWPNVMHESREAFARYVA